MRSILVLVIAMISIQGGASLAKGLFAELGAPGATFLRLFFAAAILMIAWRPWRKKFGRWDLKTIAGYGVALGAMNLLFYISLERISLGLAVALEFTGPLSVAVLASRRKIDFLWVVLATIGILLILPVLPSADAIDPKGAFFALAAGAAWAFYIVLGKRAGARSHSSVVTSIGMLMAFLVASPFGLAHSGTALLNSHLLPRGLAVAFLSSAFPYSLEMIALKKMSARNFGILMSLEPVIAAIVGWLVLHEQLTGIQCVAIGCIIVASAGSSLFSREEALEPIPV